MPTLEGISFQPVLLVLSLKAHVRAATLDGETPLHAAASNGHSDMINRLCVFGADVLAVANNGLSPLHAAAQAGHVAAVTALLENGAGRASINREPSKLHDNAFLDMVRRLRLCCSGDVSQRLAVTNSLSCGNIRGLSPLCLAACRGHVAVIETLLAHYSDCITPFQVQFSLIAAVICDHDEAIRALASTVTNDTWYEMPLLTAAVLDHSTNIKTLIALGADPSRRCFIKQITPLHAAAAYGNVHHLSVRAPRLYLKTPTGWTPLHAASSMGHLSAVEALIKNDWYATVVQARNGATPLHCAVLFGHLDVLYALARCVRVPCRALRTVAPYTAPDIRDTLVAAVSFVTTPTHADAVAHVLKRVVDDPPSEVLLATAEVRDACVRLASLVTTPNAARNLADALCYLADSAPVKTLFATAEVGDACASLAEVSAVSGRTCVEATAIIIGL
ncbi:ankyrin repeat protein, putative [Bodo saltans]|uniref:Ankyrin repeat protein, putative n=1 Tax=Bodo saltans TaxID=75058 RepID=A0A0S4IRL2_BODSA|nr:ankyrin repeat protein, putative [Bodo saltans]|eukprot:CUF44715.1 ankyrin repeat protein, putative [Bodo saltans]